MDANNGEAPKTWQDVRRLISAWYARQERMQVAFTEQVHPPNDPQESYVAEYAASFEPNDLDHMRLEMWATDDGRVSFGLETRQRVADRLGVRNRRAGFAAGHEPDRVRTEVILAVLEMVAGGQVAIASSVLPLYGLFRTRALLGVGEADARPRIGKALQRIVSIRSIDSREWREAIQYRPWT